MVPKKFLKLFTHPPNPNFGYLVVTVHWPSMLCVFGQFKYKLPTPKKPNPNKKGLGTIGEGKGIWTVKLKDLVKIARPLSFTH